MVPCLSYPQLVRNPLLRAHQVDASLNMIGVLASLGAMQNPSGLELLNDD